MGTMAAETGLQTGVWVCPGVWIPNRGYTQVFEYARAFVSPNGATYRRLDPQPRLHTGVWSPDRSYTRVSGNWSYTRVFGVPNGRSCKLPVNFRRWKPDRRMYLARVDYVPTLIQMQMVA